MIDIKAAKAFFRMKDNYEVLVHEDCEDPKLLLFDSDENCYVVCAVLICDDNFDREYPSRASMEEFAINCLVENPDIKSGYNFRFDVLSCRIINNDTGFVKHHSNAYQTA